MARITNRQHAVGINVLFAITAFLAAFLLFQIQPVMSKRILPWFGGTPTVWNTCLMFFQILLLAGYCFAHLTSRLQKRVQTTLFVFLLLCAAFIPILPGASSKPASNNASQTAHILQLLLMSVGLPFFMLSASSPLLQSWFYRILAGRSPYYLYAVGNAGSLLALLSYPFVVEPFTSVTTQARLWRVMFVLFFGCVSAIAWMLVRFKPDELSTDTGAVESSPEIVTETPLGTWMTSLLWIAWPACSVILFMSITNQLTLNIAAVPLLWVLPLAIYLLSFIVTFSGSSYYPRNAFGHLLWATLIGIYVLLPGEVTPEAILIDFSMSTKGALLLLGLFICCMVCHGELYRLRPTSADLTKYYLLISLGGAIGGVSVAIVAPSVFLLFQELQLGLVMCGALHLASHFINKEQSDIKGVATLHRMGMGTTLLAMMGVSVWLWSLQVDNSILTKRNFFGLIRVREADGTGGQTPHRTLLHGSTIHGLQFTEPERLRQLPTFYYGPITGIGIALQQPHRGRKVGIVGMGSGTLAAYGKVGDVYRFYEIDPDMAMTARSEFTFVTDSEAQCEVALGDARLSLEKEAGNGFDVLILDAFSSDAIPVHLLTVEAMEVYSRHLKPEAILAAHVTNRYLDLTSIVAKMGEANGYKALSISNNTRAGDPSSASTWVFLSQTEDRLATLVDACSILKDQKTVTLTKGDLLLASDVRPWTDDYSNIFQLFHGNW